MDKTVTNGQRRNGGMQHVRLKGWNLDWNQGSERRPRYWNHPSEDLVLRGQEKTKV
jgi:hypothetical protein